jgi:hypothetical protein
METKNYIKIYYPSKDKNGCELDTHERQNIKDLILVDLSVRLGGYTIYPVIGGYYNQETKTLISEDIEIIQAYGDYPLNVLMDISKIIKDKLNQASVMIEHNGELIFIEGGGLNG